MGLKRFHGDCFLKEKLAQVYDCAYENINKNAVQNRAAFVYGYKIFYVKKL